jgi:hypothetical protein
VVNHPVRAADAWDIDDGAAEGRLLLAYGPAWPDTAANIKTYIFRFSTYGTTVSVPVGTSGGGAVTQQGWVDLGEIPFPQGVVDIPADATGLTMPTTIPFELYVGTSDNSAGTVRADAIKFTPVTGQSVSQATIAKTFLRAIPSLANYKVTWDGVSETMWLSDGSNVVNGGMTAEVKGQFPVADPAAPKNLLVMMATKSPLTSAHTTSFNTGRKRQSTAVVSYYPRYLHIGDGT